MSKRIRFFLAQFLWIALAIGLAIGANEFSDPPVIIFPLIAMFFVTGLLMNWGSSRENLSQERGDNIVIRTLATGFMWLIYVTAVMVGAIEIGAIIIPLAVILMIPLLAMNAFMWDFFGKMKELRMAKMGQSGEQAEKRKRNRIDKVLRDLSDDDLMQLKQHLANRDVEDDDLAYMLGDDGEIVSDPTHKFGGL